MPEPPQSTRLAHVELLRNEEFQRVLPLAPPASRLLEIGAGAGWQALAFQNAGHRVEAVDLEGSTLGANARFPVRSYDGHQLPFEDSTFDLIFSSNVLEHIPHIDAMHREMQRVLKADGQAIHVVPTPAWRFWTSVTHPLWVTRRITEVIRGWLRRKPNTSASVATADSSAWRYLIWPNRHGEHGNSLTELYWFSRRSWCKQFEANGWEITRIMPVKLFYTGNQVFHHHIGLRTRALLSRFLGSATCIYVLRKSSRNDRK